jgi:malate dehydrogenase
MDHKVTVVGAGFVGATCAQRLVEQDLADTVLIDIMEGMPQGKALDLMQSAPIEGYNASIIGTNDYADTADSDVVVITAGFPRKPGMSRDDLLLANADIVKGITEQVVKYSPNSVIVTVTNPLDVMTYLVHKTSGFPEERVVGMAGVLDSARYCWFIAEALNVAPSQVNAMVLGGHGDSMVPMPRFSTVNGIAITELLSADKIDEINVRTQNGGAEIVKLLEKGSAYYAPSASAIEMVKSILHNDGKVLPCAAYLTGQYGISDVFCGVPVRLGKGGVKDIVELKLTDAELSALQKSANDVKENIVKL